MTRDYQPTEKVQLLLTAMAHPGAKLVWPARDVAATMGLPVSALGAYLLAAKNHGRIFQREYGAQADYALHRFETEAAPSGIEVPAPPPATKWSASTPPGPAAFPSRPSVEPEAKPSRTIAWPPPASSAAPAATPAPTSAPPPAPPAPTPAATPEPTAPPPAAAIEIVVIAPIETVESTAIRQEARACVWMDGAVQVWGGQRQDDGSILLPAKLVNELRLRFAWAPL